jgi:hypothetical protein
MSLSPIINGPETCLTARKRLSAKDLQIDLNDDLDIGPAITATEETDEIFLTNEETSPVIDENFQTTGDTSPTTGDPAVLTSHKILPVISETLEVTEETSPDTGQLLPTARETSPAVGENFPPTDETDPTSDDAADHKSTLCNGLLANSTNSLKPSSDSVLDTVEESDRDLPTIGDKSTDRDLSTVGDTKSTDRDLSTVGDTKSTDSPGVGAEPLTPQLPPDEIALLAKLEEANRRLEADRKSLHSVSPLSQRKGSMDPQPAGDAPRLSHSRHGSLSSQMSSLSASSTSSNPPMEEVPDDLWSTWKSLVDDWDNKSKRKSLNLKVNIFSHHNYDMKSLIHDRDLNDILS